MWNKKTILIILAVAAVVSLIYGIKTPAKRSIPPEVETVSQVMPVSSVARIVPTQRRTKKTEFTSWGRNPFSSAEIHGAIGQSVVLNGIVWDRQNPSAIIGDEIVVIGDKVGNNTVVDITPDSVTLNDGSRDFKLRIAE